MGNCPEEKKMYFVKLLYPHSKEAQDIISDYHMKESDFTRGAARERMVTLSIRTKAISGL